MKRIKRAVAVLLAVMMVFSVIGCGGSSGSKKSDSSSKETKDAKTEEVWGDKSGQDEICGDPDGKYTIGVVIHTTTDFLCAKYKAYTDYLGKAYGVKFNYYIIENFADETYLSAIENLCAQGVDGIITTNFSGTAVLQGLKICEENEVYLGVGWSQIDESIKDQVYKSDYFVGGSYEADYDAGYLHNDGVYAWTTDEVDQLIKSKNKNASSDELLEMGKNYSIEDTIARHGK